MINFAFSLVRTINLNIGCFICAHTVDLTFLLMFEADTKLTLLVEHLAVLVALDFMDLAGCVCLTTVA